MSKGKQSCKNNNYQKAKRQNETNEQKENRPPKDRQKKTASRKNAQYVKHTKNKGNEIHSSVLSNALSCC